jgi:hypothetical protein
MAWLLEFATGVGVCLGGIGLWALPKDTPVIGRPPVLVGWLVIALGVLIIALSMVTRSGFEIQPPRVRRKAPPLARYDIPRPERTDSAPIPAPQKIVRVYTDANVAELVALGRTAGLTNAERARLLAPHVGKWLRIEGAVDDVNVYPGFVQVIIRIDPALPPPIVFFRSDLDRVAALRKGARIHMAGRFTGVAPPSDSVAMDDCELLD